MCFENVNEILSLYLKDKKWKKHYSSIIFFLYSVNKGFKPSILWDIGPNLNIDVLKNIIKHLKESSFLNPFIYLLTYESEIFIINLEIICHHLKKFSSYIKFIDCSLTIDKPVVIIECDKLDYITEIIYFLTKHLCKFLESHNNKDISSDDLLNLKYENKMKFLCPPTIFGILLGYPVVYWSNNMLNGNCLSFIPLNVFKLKIKDPVSSSKMNNDNILYSFSVPAYLNLNNFVDYWFKSLNPAITEDFVLFKEVVTLPCVQL